MKLLTLTALTGAAILAASVSFADDHAASAEWSYDGDTGAANWGKLSADNAVCDSGKLQSPFDITGYKVDADLPDLVFNYPVQKTTPLTQSKLGVMVNIADGASLNVGDESYKLLQFHFHAPSEYAINGKQYPLAAHLVHQAEDGTLAVVGVLFEEGAANPALQTLVSKLDTKKDGMMEIPTSFDVTDLLPEDRRYYRFSGSLTTPPCSENVRWHLLPATVTASAEQLAAFEARIPNTARPLTPMNNRLIILDSE